MNDTGQLWWAVVSQRSGYALDVTPEDATRYRRDLPAALGMRSRLVGEFPTEAAAMDAVKAALARRRGVHTPRFPA